MLQCARRPAYRAYGETENDGWQECYVSAHFKMPAAVYRPLDRHSKRVLSLLHSPQFLSTPRPDVKEVKRRVMVDKEKEASIEKGFVGVELHEVDLMKVNSESGVSKGYELKCQLINRCLQEEIGFGRYQIELFVLTGLGWFADKLWFQGLDLVLPQVQQELDPVRIEFATLALHVGLIIGASVWGVLADIIGRRVSFNITLFIAGVFGIASASSPNFTTFGALIACLGLGVGGKCANFIFTRKCCIAYLPRSIPVDSMLLAAIMSYLFTLASGALYLENIPKSSQWTLTLLSAWWAVGHMVASMIAWGLVGSFSCASDIPIGQCPKAENMGWRYTVYESRLSLKYDKQLTLACRRYTIGALTLVMFICRFFLFDLQESPKYLVANGRDEEAIEVMKHLAQKNGKTITLTLDQLQAVSGNSNLHPRSISQLLKPSSLHVSLSHVKPLFAGKKLAVNTTIVFFLWAIIGLADALFYAFLPFYLRDRIPSGHKSVSATYQTYTIESILGLPGSLIACAVVDWTRKAGRYSFGGKRLVMAVSTTLTGACLFLFTTSNTQAAVLGYTYASAVTSNANLDNKLYGVLYAYTPEVFPAPHRGTGNAIASSLSRIAAIFGPVIKIATTSAEGAGATNGQQIMTNDEKEVGIEMCAVDVDQQGDDLMKVNKDNGVSKAYELKCHLINRCMQEEIGLGRYQIELFVLTGFGWFAAPLNATYRENTIQSVLGIPGTLIACAVVDWSRRRGGSSFGGEKLVMSIFTALTGVFLFLFTTSSSQAAVLGYTYATALTSGAIDKIWITKMYGVLYAYTPEIFPAPHRGTADSIASTINRITGIFSPVILIVTTSAVGTTEANVNGPLFVSASLFMVAAFLMIFLPIGTAGKAAL
ncbi:hypothetical protein CVT26_012747 [Gymnopilus dilepis]|uniref:Major facilitator superfamily (MFS) profile domain-containing protein n=1 Tax=Gymnopilus dilepis TaxID=231916 RepID=A0A409WDM1_9AGAR|nr:hypothetical protein CVT26_012747 [Gymnopilus dilepis]